jgi:hypothetical protein
MKRTRMVRRLISPLLGGALLMQAGPCVRGDVGDQFRSGILSAITGFFRIGQLDE